MLVVELMDKSVQACMHECVCACVDFQSVPSLLGYAYCFYEDIVCVSRVPCPKYISREIDFYCQIDSFMNQKKKRHDNVKTFRTYGSCRPQRGCMKKKIPVMLLKRCNTTTFWINQDAQKVQLLWKMANNFLLSQNCLFFLSMLFF